MIDPIELLGRQVPAFTIGAETRLLHLARIDAALMVPAAVAQASLADPGRFRSATLAKLSLSNWRHKATAAMVAFVVAVPSAAVATEGTQPDTWLYPVKLAVEPIWRLMDGEIVAQHRIEELQLALDASQPAYGLLARAEQAVGGLNPDSVWRNELALIKESLADAPDRSGTDRTAETDLVDQSGDSDGSNGVEDAGTLHDDSEDSTDREDDSDTSDDDDSDSDHSDNDDPEDDDSNSDNSDEDDSDEDNSDEDDDEDDEDEDDDDESDS